MTSNILILSQQDSRKNFHVHKSEQLERPVFQGLLHSTPSLRLVEQKQQQQQIVIAVTCYRFLEKMLHITENVYCMNSEIACGMKWTCSCVASHMMVVLEF